MRVFEWFCKKKKCCFPWYSDILQCNGANLQHTWPHPAALFFLISGNKDILTVMRQESSVLFLSHGYLCVCGKLKSHVFFPTAEQPGGCESRSVAAGPRQWGAPRSVQWGGQQHPCKVQRGSFRRWQRPVCWSGDSFCSHFLILLRCVLLSANSILWGLMGILQGHPTDFTPQIETTSQ